VRSFLRFFCTCPSTFCGGVSDTVLTDFTSFEDDYSQIEGADMWNDLRERYYKKKMDKINGVRYHDKKSFQIFHEAVNETLQKFHI
jgi:hypothetical protein